MIIYIIIIIIIITNLEVISLSSMNSQLRKKPVVYPPFIIIYY